MGETERLPSGITVYLDAPVFGERRWCASHPDCCGQVRAFTRAEAIELAKMGCKHCAAKPITDAYAAPRGQPGETE